jgi:hypothetical protein
MEMSDLSYWFWPALSFLLTVLWLWTLLRQRRGALVSRTSGPGLMPRLVEAEDALKAAYALQEAEGTWGDEELARSVGLSGAMAGGVAGGLIASGWAEEGGGGARPRTDPGTPPLGALPGGPRGDALGGGPRRGPPPRARDDAGGAGETGHRIGTPGLGPPWARYPGSGGAGALPAGALPAGGRDAGKPAAHRLPGRRTSAAAGPTGRDGAEA